MNALVKILARMGNVCIDDQINEYTCPCITGLTGENCETNIDDCVAEVNVRMEQYVWME